jgi:hypothetical protein
MLAAGTIEGFAAECGAVLPTATPRMQLLRSSLIVLGTHPTEVAVGAVDIAWKEEAFPLYAHPWRPETREPWESKPSEMEPQAAEGLDFSPALGRSLEISILSIAERFNDEAELLDVDVGFVFAVENWRLLVESAEYFDHPDHLGPMDLVLTTDAAMIEAHVGMGTLRDC